MQSSSRSANDVSVTRECELLLRGVGEITTLSGIEWLRELARARLPNGSADLARDRDHVVGALGGARRAARTR